MPKRNEKTFVERLGIGASVGEVLGRGHTGRRIHVGDDYRLAEAWSGLADRRDLLAHSAANRFREEVAAVPPLHDIELRCVRGRLDNGAVRGWEDMGPPQTPHENRYNSPSQTVLYLCDSRLGVNMELCPEGRCRLLLQEYILPLISLKLADFSNPDLSEFVDAAFDMAESSRVSGRAGRADFLFSQLLADLVREAGFHGMLVPGVRGDPERRYLNVVVFDPPTSRDWRLWSLRDSGFRLVVT